MKYIRKLKGLCFVVSLVMIFNFSQLNASADSNRLNIKVYLASNEFTVYGLPDAYSNRFRFISGTTHGFYYVVAGIDVELYSGLSSEYIKQTYLETCSDCKQTIINNKSKYNHSAI